MKRVWLVSLLLLSVAPPAVCQTAGEVSVPPASAQAAQVRFDPIAATDAYLARVSGEQRARSDAYFEGGYWLQLWHFLLGLGIAWLILGTGLSTTIRDRAERWTYLRWLQTLIYAVAYILLTALLSFPLTLYEGFFREHQYQLSNQTFGAWFRDALMGLAVGVILGGLGLVVLYEVLRRAPRSWWVWGTVVSSVFLLFFALIFPVFIAPLFNTYTPLKDPALRGQILSLARANGIPAQDVYQVDASRQSKRVSANVSGFAGTLRISLNDNLLNRCSSEEIQEVMGHEMGHYALNHVYEGLLFGGVEILLGFAFVRWAFQRVVTGFGSGWGIRGVADIAGLPLLSTLLAVFFFVLTPLDNTFTRTNEAEADLFGLNASRQPDGAAEVALKLGEYRKLSPGPMEEWIFFDHPSGRNRILMAMRWKAEHLAELPAPPPPSPR
ncbi:MAG: M48 family metallopeptidase [Acidobacteria bacterium]|nr:M48 family metallopeptidase [Acidobacteriota bacterium]